MTTQAPRGLGDVRRYQDARRTGVQGDDRCGEVVGLLRGDGPSARPATSVVRGGAGSGTHQASAGLPQPVNDFFAKDPGDACAIGARCWSSVPAYTRCCGITTAPRRACERPGREQEQRPEDAAQRAEECLAIARHGLRLDAATRGHRSWRDRPRRVQPGPAQRRRRSDGSSGAPAASRRAGRSAPRLTQPTAAPPDEPGSDAQCRSADRQRSRSRCRTARTGILQQGPQHELRRDRHPRPPGTHTLTLQRLAGAGQGPETPALLACRMLFRRRVDRGPVGGRGPSTANPAAAGRWPSASGVVRRVRGVDWSCRRRWRWLSNPTCFTGSIPARCYFQLGKSLGYLARLAAARK